MTPQTKYLLLFVVLFCGFFSYAQQKPTPATKADSAAFYRKIEKYSKKRKFTSFVHGLIFEPMTPRKIKAQQKIQSRNFTAFQGKIIRKINIQTLDPFGYSEMDSTKQPEKTIAKLGNRFHLKTKRLTILNMLLLRRNKPFDSLQALESERLIRAQRFVRRVVIVPRAIPSSKDSIDVEIRSLDSWSLIPDFSASGSRMDYELTERNFLGIGHNVRQQYERNIESGDDAYSVRYMIPNIMNTYVQTTLNYDIDLLDNYEKSVNIERPFFSPLAKWAGGVYFDQRFRRDTLRDAENNFEWQNFKKKTSDIWAGYSVTLLKGDAENKRTTNLIMAARYYKINFQEVPLPAFDTVNFYSTERNYMVSMGIASRQFVQDRYLFNYGIIEDVPVGRVIGLTGGVQRKHLDWRTYIGARFSSGAYYRLGYWGTNLEYGTYLRSGVPEQSAVSFRTNYFTNLYELGRWKFRQAIKGEMVIGNDREASWGDMLTLRGPNGIPGFRSATLYGTKKWLITTQTQSYAPWDLLGFRLNPFLSYSIGMLGDAAHGFEKSKAYSQIGIGLLISNDYLVFSTFQLSLSFFPTMPDRDTGIFKNNTFSTEDFGLMDYEFGKPRTVLYE